MKHTVVEQERIKKHKYLIDKYKDYNKKVEGVTKIKVLLDFDKDDLSEKNFILFGRATGRRDMGKSMFVDLLDDGGKIQLFISTKVLDETSLDYINNLDVGDFISVQGKLMKTKLGQLSLRVSAFKIVTKSLTPLPDKWHGLKDEEDLIRKRYLDLLLNKERKEIFEKRQKGIDELRKYFNSIGCKEVQTPSISTLSTGAIARPFETYHNTLDSKMFMRIAPELYLKRLIAGNFGKVFEIARCFRNEGISNKHNPEFDLLEVYVANAGIEEMMHITEESIKSVVKNLKETMTIQIRDNKINFSKPFKKITMRDCVKDVIGVDVMSLNEKDLSTLAKKYKIDQTKNNSHGLVLNSLFELKAEETLIQPSLVYNTPIEVSPLARKSSEDERFASRFELFICGVELANGYSEQNDFFEQRDAFLKQAEKREKGNFEVADFDEDYLIMLKHGLPPTGGLGIGIDRLLMLLLDLKTIKDIILFPTIKNKVTKHK